MLAVPVAAVVAAATLVVVAAPASAAVTTVDVAVTCNLPNTPPQHTTAIVTVRAPNFARVGHNIKVFFTVQLPYLNPVLIDLSAFSLSSTWKLQGAVSPASPGVLTQGPQAYSAGDTIVFATYARFFHATGDVGGSIGYEFDQVFYDFTFGGGGGSVPAVCTNDGGPVIVSTTPIVAS